MPSICVDQLNILIWRYLQENGYNHAAYTFGLESSITEVETDCAHSALIPIGALVRLMYKGIMYTEAEDNDKKSYSLLEAVFRLDANQQAAAADSSDDEPEKIDESEQDSAEDEEEGEDEDDDESEDDDSDDDIEIIKRPSIPSTESILARSKTTRGLVRIKPSSQSTSAASASTPSTSAKKPAPMTLAEKKMMQRREAAKPQKAPERKHPIYLEGSMVKYLTGHNAEAFICSWNPKDIVVASGSGDSTGRLWYLHNADTTPAKMLEKQSKILKHTFSGAQSSANANKQVNHDVTSLDWSTDGTKLATGCYDGFARIWSKEGHLQSCLEYHKGPIFAVKWNVTGDYLVTAGVDKSTVVWNADGTMKQSYMVHESSALDVDWVSQDSFASCSTDKKIMICKVNHLNPIQILIGHQNEVNAIRYDPHSDRIASCSDDKTLKIWSVKQESALFTFNDHVKEIYTLRWSPNGHIVASASFDHTVRLFDVNQGQCIKVLQGHTDPVYSVTFSPDGRYIASGCFDRSVFVWDVRSGTCVGKYVGDKNDGGIFEVSWSHTGNRLAASASDGKIILMDVRKII